MMLDIPVQSKATKRMKARKVRNRKRKEMARSSRIRLSP
jgi:hypothetical protein